jgi:hypothetical protein
MGIGHRDEREVGGWWGAEVGEFVWATEEGV